MTSRISHTTFDRRDAFALSTFWKQVLGYGDVPGDPNEPGHEECMIVGPGHEPKLLFIEVPEGKQVKNRAHLDLEPTDRARDAEIERVVALGATPLHDLRNDDGGGCPESGWFFNEPHATQYDIVGRYKLGPDPSSILPRVAVTVLDGDVWVDPAQPVNDLVPGAEAIQQRPQGPYCQDIDSAV